MLSSSVHCLKPWAAGFEPGQSCALWIQPMVPIWGQGPLSLSHDQLLPGMQVSQKLGLKAETPMWDDGFPSSIFMPPLSYSDSNSASSSGCYSEWPTPKCSFPTFGKCWLLTVHSWVPVEEFTSVSCLVQGYGSSSDRTAFLRLVRWECGGLTPCIISGLRWSHPRCESPGGMVSGLPVYWITVQLLLSISLHLPCRDKF